MRKVIATLVALAACLAAAAPAAADFGVHDLEVRYSDMRAGSHPDFENSFEVNTIEDPTFGEIPDGQPRNLTVELPEGFVGSPHAVPQCSASDFLTTREVLPGVFGGSFPDCPDGSALGTVTVRGSVGGAPLTATSPVYNLVPPPGVASKMGFLPLAGARVTIDTELREEPPYDLIAQISNITQMERFFSAKLVLWGNPADPDHDERRGICLVSKFLEDVDTCPAGVAERPFLTMPRSCPGTPLLTDFEMLSWQGDTFFERLRTPEPVRACERLDFGPRIDVAPTARAASAASGLDIFVEVPNEGIEDPAGRSASDIKRAEVTFPEGMTINPSQAEGLGTCTEADFARESATSAFGSGCPGDSKIGTVEVTTPLLDDTTLRGNLFVATPRANPFGTLIALYMTITEPRLGIGVKLAGKVVPDPDTGRLIGSFGDPGHELPQLPVSSFHLRFREGARSPLITPRRCGDYTATARFTPWSDPSRTHTDTASFEIQTGPGGRPCPPAGAPPFEPGFSAGAANPVAGAYSPFLMRITRRDGDADLRRFDAALPPGAVARLAGVGRCGEERIALARTKSGRAERSDPSCPLDSRIGGVLAGAGAGSQLTYVPGDLYLAGPFEGAPLSVVSIVPALAGPFDVGTVVTRFGLVVDPVSARVRVASSASELIPRLLAGIPLSLRDLQVRVDRSEFTLNPTSCAPAAVRARLLGTEGTAADRASRYQVAGCRGLGFGPLLGLRLRGGIRRGANPALVAVLGARPGEANLARAVVRLPSSAFLDQAHIRTICTRVQFAADSCPRGAIYGRAVAHTPLLAEPLRGPVYLRSSNNELPDLVIDLKGVVDIETAARIDSVRGGIRATFPAIPDAPLSRVVLRMAGGKRGLIVNSTNLCAKANRAGVFLAAHSGARLRRSPLVRPTACKRLAAKRKAAKRRAAGPRASVARARPARGG